jgi:uncharacterized protein (DUF2236 family)
MQERMRSEGLFVTPEAREIGRKVALELPLPATRRAALPAVNLAVVGTLPPRVRKLYGIAWSPAHDAAFIALKRGTRLSRPLLPRVVRRGSSVRDYEIVAQAEKHQLAKAA